MSWGRYFPSLERPSLIPSARALLSILKEYQTPERLLAEEIKILASKIKALSRKSFDWAYDKASSLKMLASNSPSLKEGLSSNITRLFSYTRIIGGHH
jgi:hypothetical protein